MSLDYTKYLNLDPVKNDSSIINSSQFLYLLDFLNSSRAGAAQNTSGISFQTFISSFMISLLYCAFQTSIFSLLRCKLKNIYQPNCFYVADSEKIPPIGQGYFDWIPDVLTTPLRSYRCMGLDAYFFLRYLLFLLILFIGLAVFNIPVLIPVNYCSGYDKYTDIDVISFTNGSVPRISGLDRISMSNIAPKFSNRLSIHLTMAIISVFWFHGLVIVELWNFIKIKNSHLAEQIKKPIKPDTRDFSNTILIDNVPSKLLDRKELRNMFEKICGSKIKSIWFIFNYRDLNKYHRTHLKLLDRIESLETSIIEDKFYHQTDNNLITDIPRYRKNRFMASLRSLSNVRVRFIWRVIPFIYTASLRDQIGTTSSAFVDNRHKYLSERQRLIMRETGPMKDHKFNKVFIQFENPLHSHIINQIQISNRLNELDNTLIYVNPKDIIWENLSVQSNMFAFLRTVIGDCLEWVVILGWVVPVAFIGLVSQLPYLTALMPVLKWLNFLPDYITDVISNLLSVFLLVCLSQLVPYVLRWLSFVKCKRSGAEVQIDVQQWMYIFLFIHIFLVVTISSGFSVIIEGLLNNPVSIPNILAMNLPKCSNFFFTYVIIRGLSYFGNNLIQNYQLFMNFFVYPIKDFTARRKFKRLANPPTYLWGSTYPTITVIGSIGLVYSILSPLILIFCCFSFFMVLLSFKYSLKYQFNYVNNSETHGQFYPRAIFQLYSGIYFMEVCLIGMFALSRDENNQANCLYHALLTFGLLIVTAVAQNQIQKLFGKLLTQNLPLIMNERQVDREPAISSEIKDYKEELFNDTFYQKCFQHGNTIAWLPSDDFGIASEEIKYLKELGIDCSTENCKLSNNGDVTIFNCPPDYLSG